MLANQFHTLLDSSWYSQNTQHFLYPFSRFGFFFHKWKFTYSIPSPLIFYSSVNLLSNGRLNRCTHILYNTHTMMSHFIFGFFIPLTVCHTVNTILFSFHRIGSKILNRFSIRNRKEMWNVLSVPSLMLAHSMVPNVYCYLPIVCLWDSDVKKRKWNKNRKGSI